MNIKSKLTAAFMLLMLMLMPGVITAQNPMMQPLPVDTAVRIGQLPNGLTYYIRHNEYPKGQADFYIAQKVGSILEEDNQRGLAHFLEHMCFNGTTHFPGSSLRDWLETVGVKFGVNLNAYTGVDQTVYNISNVPVARTSVQDSCLLILHDWANDLLLEPEEIDKERGVIHEEWRRSNVGQMRILERILPELYPGSKYGHRLPIGTMEVVDNFPYQALRDYYETWYRPDQQAVIVVGDIDVDRIENKIKEMFADIEMPENAKERVYEPVADHEGTIYTSGADPEQTSLMAEIMWLSDPMPREAKNTMIYFVESYLKSMISSMLNQRIDELGAKPDAPFSQAGVYFSDYFVAKTKDSFNAQVVAKGDKIDPALEAVYREVLRAAKGGFTSTEYDRARNEFLSRIERSYNNRATRESGAYVNEYVNSFIDGEPIPGIEFEYELYNALAPSIPVEAINQTMAQLITDDNRVVMALAPEKDGIIFPTKEAMAAVMTSVEGEELTAFVDDVKTEPLIPALPNPGKIVETSSLDQFGAIVWTLSNGVKVYIKPTKFKEDEILFSANSNDGYQNLGKEFDATIRFFDEVGNENGLGTYTHTDLAKYTTGKQASLGVDFGNFSRSISGFATPKDLPTLMELIYMTFTDYTFSPDEFAAQKSSVNNRIAHQESNPQFIFMKNLYNSIYSDERMLPLDTVTVNAASLEQTIALAHEMTKNAADYDFFFVGNVDLDVLGPLVEQYIATLPADAAKADRKAATLKPQYQLKKGSATDVATAKMGTPQTWVAIFDAATVPFNTKNAFVASMAGQILSNRLLKVVREEMGAVYSIGAAGALDRKGDLNAIIQTAFPMKPEMKDTVLTYIAEEMVNMGKNVTPDELAPIKEYMVKSFTESKEKNYPWLNALIGYMTDGIDTFNGNVEVVNEITVDDIMDFMKQLDSQNNYRVVILDPEE